MLQGGKKATPNFDQERVAVYVILIRGQPTLLAVAPFVSLIYHVVTNDARHIAIYKSNEIRYNNRMSKGGTVYEDHTFVRPSPGEAGA